MASFSLDRTTLSLLAGCITVGLDGVSDSAEAQAIAALLEELDAIACANGSAEVTIVRDEPSEVDEIAAKITQIRKTAGATAEREADEARELLDDRDADDRRHA